MNNNITHQYIHNEHFRENTIFVHTDEIIR